MLQGDLSMRIAVIDVSSSSVSFIVADAGEGGAQTVFKERILFSLINYMEGKSLSDRGKEKLVFAIASAKDKCIALKADKAYLIGTAALRQIDNFAEVQSAVDNSLGMKINLVDGKWEGYFDVLANEAWSAPDAALADIGGASMEICGFADRSAEHTRLFSFGVFDLNRKFVRGVQPDAEEAKKIKKYLKKKFDGEKLPEKGKYSSLVLVGATNLAVYDVYSDFVGSEGEEKSIDVAKFRKFVKHLVSDAGRSALVLKSAPERVHVVTTAAVTLNCLFRRLRPERVTVSETGVKEGYLLYILSDNGKGEACDLAATEAPDTDEVRGGEAQTKPVGATAKKRGRKKGQKTASAAQATAVKADGQEGSSKTGRGRRAKSADRPQEGAETKPKRRYVRRKPTENKPAQTVDEGGVQDGDVGGKVGATEESN